jgi:hypothetical protein
MYGYETPKYNIPAQTVGNIIEGQEEQRAANILDTQLYGLMRSNNSGHGVIATGSHVETFAAGNISFVTFNENKSTGKMAVEALINQVYVGNYNSFTFTGIPDVGTFYLYVRLVEDNVGQSSVERGEFSTYVSSSATPPANGILIATATTNGSSIVVDDNPTGRINIPTLADHVADNTDPHGNLLIQTNLTVTNDLIVSGTASFNTIRADILSGGNAQFTGTLSGVGIVAMNSLVISGGAIWRGIVNILGDVNFPNPISFAQNLVMASGVSVDGRDLSVDGATLDAHILNMANPHQTTIAQLSGLNKYGDTLEGNLEVQSGKTIDGIDPTALKPLINGSDATLLHTHSNIYPLSGLRTLTLGVEYAGAVISGVDIGLITRPNASPFMNVYEIVGLQSGVAGIIVLRQPIPSDVLSVPPDFMTLYGAAEAGNQIEVLAFDTDNVQLELSNNVFTSPSLVQQTVSFSGVPAFAKDKLATIQMRAACESGTKCYLGDYGLRFYKDFSGS